MHDLRLVARRLGMAALLGVVATTASGCALFRWGPGHAPTDFEYQGIINAYASADDLRAYDGDIVKVDMLNRTEQNGEILNVDVWPIAGVGIGAFGARVHVVTLGAGIGTVFYNPQAEGDLVNVENKEVKLDVK